jgi:hypothetical protein
MLAGCLELVMAGVWAYKLALSTAGLKDDGMVVSKVVEMVLW